MSSNGGIIGVDNNPTTSTKITTFNASGTFTATSAEADMLIIAGGAGGSIIPCFSCD